MRKSSGGYFNILVVSVLAVFLALFFSCNPAMGAGKTVRVAFPYQQGITEVTSEGEYTGYTYDYLIEVAKYTGWRYEFVQADGNIDEQISTLMDMLIDGQVDIMGCMAYSDELAELFDYSGANYGVASKALCVLKENSDITSINYFEKKLKVAVFKRNGEPDVNLEQFAKMSGFEAEQLVCSTEDETFNKLYSGEADAILLMDISADTDEMRVIARFSPRPFYFAVTKGNYDVVQSLNLAIESINIDNPNFIGDLTFKYFLGYDTGKVTLDKFVSQNPQQAVLIFSAMLSLSIFVIILLMWSKYRERRNQYLRRLENERYEQISDLSNEYLYEYDIRSDRVKLPEKSASFLGWSRVTDNASVKASDLDNISENDIIKAIISSGDKNCEMMCTVAGGSKRWIRITAKTIYDESGAAIYNVGRISDIHQQKEVQEELINRAQKDSLTGTYNSAAIRELIDKLLREENQHGALFIIDIDYFKNINDSYGHYTGDEILKEVSVIFTDIFRKNDIVGRLGGDEFAIYMRDVQDRRLIIRKCEILKERTASIERIGNKGIVTLSIGIAMTSHDRSFDTLYRQADTALYEVKNGGRNSYKIFESHMERDDM